MYLSILQEVASTPHMINVDEWVFWLKFAGALIAVVSAIATPIMVMLRRYSTGLNEAKEAIKAQGEINDLQASCISASEEERKELREDMALIKDALLTIMRVELNKECGKAISNGCIEMERRNGIVDMFGAYEKLGGNHGVGSSVRTVERLPVRRRE